MAPAALSLVLCACDAPAQTVEITDYYPGKDEACVSAEAQTLRAGLDRIIVIVDVYAESDRELSCTLVVTPDGLAEQRRYSLSGSNCQPLLAGPTGQQLTLTVVKDHVCTASWD